MKISDQQLDKAITLFCVVVGFLILMYTLGQSMDFQKRCEAKCGDAPALTPVMDFGEKCLCGEGNGRWRVEEIGAN